MSMQIKPSRLYNKALWEGGSIINNGEKVYRAFRTKLDTKFIQQIISRDGSYEAKVWQGDFLVKTVGKKLQGKTVILDIWDNVKHTGKIIENTPIDSESFLQRVWKKTGLNCTEAISTVTKFTKGKGAKIL